MSGVERMGGEAALLIECCRAEETGESKERISALCRKPLDWNRFLELAVEHQVAPMAHRFLRRCAIAAPESALAALRRAAETTAQRNLLLGMELTRLLDLLSSQGIEAMALKGPFFAQRYYGSMALREFFDVDLLVPRKEVLRVKRLLSDQGYRPEYRWGRLREQWQLRFHSEYNFRRSGGFPVEIHWRLFPSYLAFRVAPSALWECAEPAQWGGARIRTLSLDLSLLSMSVHNGAKHFWLCLRFICDFARLLRAGAGRVDWNVLYLRAERLGCRRMLAIAVLLAREVLGEKLESDCEALATADRTAVDLARRIECRLFERRVPGTGDNAIGRYLLYCRMRERLRDRIRYLPHLVVRLCRPTKRDRSLLDLHGVLAAAYLLLRPVRLAARLLETMVHGGD